MKLVIQKLPKIITDMKRIQPLLILAALLGVLTAGIAADTAPQKPNVLFLVVDDLRPELGCYGKDYIKSPNIDGLARAGMVFNRAYCQQATCSPSRTAVLTGVRPDTSKVWDLVTHFRKALPDVVTLGQQFMMNGYFVQGMGKVFHNTQNDPPSWSVPWQTPRRDIYALPEAAASVGVKAEPVDEDGPDNKGTDPGSYSLPKTNASGKGTAASGSTEKKANKRGRKASSCRRSSISSNRSPPARML